MKMTVTEGSSLGLQRQRNFPTFYIGQGDHSNLGRCCTVALFSKLPEFLGYTLKSSLQTCWLHLESWFPCRIRKSVSNRGNKSTKFCFPTFILGKSFMRFPTMTAPWVPPILCSNPFALTQRQPVTHSHAFFFFLYNVPGLQVMFSHFLNIMDNHFFSWICFQVLL